MAPRLSRERWVEAGLAALRDEGWPGLAAERLARRLEVSRGSFYWHFSNALDFEAAVLAEWEERWTSRIIAAVAEAGGGPRERLRALIERTGGRDASVYASAKQMAMKHPRMEEAMRRIDERRIAFVADMLIDAGIAWETALLRARIVYAWAMGHMLVSPEGAVSPETAQCLTEFAFRM